VATSRQRGSFKSTWTWSISFDQKLSPHPADTYRDVYNNFDRADQLVRSAESVVRNIAAAAGRWSDGDASKHLTKMV
jgi:23S rRNA-intervening sequence protein